MYHYNTIKLCNIKKHINMHITKSITGVPLKEPKEKERIHTYILFLLHTKRNTLNLDGILE